MAVDLSACRKKPTLAIAIHENVSRFCMVSLHFKAPLFAEITTTIKTRACIKSWYSIRIRLGGIQSSRLDEDYNQDKFGFKHNSVRSLKLKQ